MSKKKELELYIHIPFCVRKCEYCDFLSGLSDDKTRQLYVDALIREIEMHKGNYKAYEVTTIFMGGGTPSILNPKQIASVFRAIRTSFDLKENAEITIEVNPGTVTETKAQAWIQEGINRVSIGLQSVNDEELRMLGRIHTYKQFCETYELLRKTGFENLNVDLISAIPGQTVESWRKTLRTVAELNPEHISAYSLIIEAGTPFYEKFVESDSTDLPPLPDEDSDRIIYEETEQILLEYGYSRYEISNYAKEGYLCKHNEGYWRRKEYLGIGLGASSLMEHKRFCNLSDMDEYNRVVTQGGNPHEEEEELSVEDEMEEFMFLGLRMMSGVCKKEFYQCFQKTMDEVYGEQLNKLQNEKLIEISGDQVYLTKYGIDISNYVFEQFLL